MKKITNMTVKELANLCYEDFSYALDGMGEKEKEDVCRIVERKIRHSDIFETVDRGIYHACRGPWLSADDAEEWDRKHEKGTDAQKAWIVDVLDSMNQHACASILRDGDYEEYAKLVAEWREDDKTYMEKTNKEYKEKVEYLFSAGTEGLYERAKGLAEWLETAYGKDGPECKAARNMAEALERGEDIEAYKEKLKGYIVAG